MTSRDRLVLNAVLRSNFRSFLQRCFLTLNPGATFYDNWHIEAIAYHLELVRLGRVRRLIINVPPRFLKSTICSVAFPAFVLGHEPTKRLIVASYSSELATKLGNEFRAIMESRWYRSAFRNSRISRIKSSETEVMTVDRGYRLAASVGGSLTSRGGDIVILDDPLKAQDAYSDRKRGAVNDWFRSTLLSRLDDPRTGAIIIVMQRLHEDDPTGALLRDSADWTLLSLPAIAEDEEKVQIGDDSYHFRKPGDLLHPEKWPRDALESRRTELGSLIFSAHYQQSPVVARGNLIKREWIRRYDVLPPQTSSTYVLQSWDTALKVGEQNDWSVCVTFHIPDDGRYHLAHVLRERLDFPALRARAIEHARIHRPSVILIEDSGVGTALIAELRNQQFAVVGVQPNHNKQVRMSIQSAKFQSGMVLLPHSAPWLAETEAEIIAFPASRHDDQVDAISQALDYKIQRGIWTDQAVKGLSDVVTALAWDQAFGRLAGRPW